MIIGQRVLPNARLSDDVGIWESSIVYEACISCLRRKQLSVL